MTAEALADLVHGRLTGRARWLAKCPAHRDHSPSLSIQEGREGRVLVRCWAGCSLQAILATLSLVTRDLFLAESRTPAMAARARRKRAEQDAEASQPAVQERRLGDIYRRVGFVVDAVARKLAQIPDGHQPERAKRLTGLLHTAIDWQRAAEAGFGYG